MNEVFLDYVGIGILVFLFALGVSFIFPKEQPATMCSLNVSGDLDVNNSMLANISMNNATITNIQLTFPCEMMGYG